MSNLPRKIGPFAIECELGRGGMGIVYKATDSRLNRLVAIKSLHEQALDQPESRVRFEQEARALAALNHANIAGLHGLEQAGDQLFLVLEYVDGETLSARLRRGPMPVAETLAVCGQIAAGLAAAHAAGIVHRDLKPANVKITPNGQVKVLDFGLAQMAAPAPTAAPADETQAMAPREMNTSPGTLLGTMPYMCPEQLRGEAVDKRADIWSWAVIAYECLTGANPFAKGTASDTIAAVLGTGPDLAALPPDTPPLLLALLRRCLQPKREARLREAGDLRLLLEDSAREVSAAPAGALPRAVIVDKTFLIGDEACRMLEQKDFDPHLIGWQMQYADNERASDVLQVWVPSFGEDHSMGLWRELLAASPFRTIVATPIGLEPRAAYRPRISLTNQLILLRRLVAAVAAHSRVRRVVIGGFS